MELSAHQYTKWDSTGLSIFLLIAVQLIFNNAFADPNLRREYSVDERILINETTLRYRECVYQNALSEIEKHDDIRYTAGLAIDACQHEIDQLDKKLTERNLDPNFFHGMLASIKNRTIHRLLPALMMQKSNTMN